ASRRVATKLARHRRRTSAETAGDVANTGTLRAPDRDVFALGERQVATGDHRGQTRIHPSSVAEPPERDGERDAGFGRNFFGLQPSSDRRPECNLVATPRNRRSPRRGDLSPIQLTNSL